MLEFLTDNLRSALANVRFAFVFTCTWLMPGMVYSTGSSTVTMLTVGLLISLRKEYSVVDFPQPVGPVRSTIPYECAKILSMTTFSSSVNPRSARVKLNALLRLTVMTLSHCCSDILIIRPSRVMPALLTSTSM